MAHEYYEHRPNESRTQKETAQEKRHAEQKRNRSTLPKGSEDAAMMRCSKCEARVPVDEDCSKCELRSVMERYALAMSEKDARIAVIEKEIQDYRDQNEQIAEMRIEDCERAERAESALERLYSAAKSVCRGGAGPCVGCEECTEFDEAVAQIAKLQEKPC